MAFLQTVSRQRRIMFMSNKVSYKTHSLVNKRTGKRASNTTWLLDLAACAVVLEQDAGLPSLLPQDKGRKLLEYNELKPFKRHKPAASEKNVATSHSEMRRLAQKAMPSIAAYYALNVVTDRPTKAVNRKGFAHWISREMADKKGGLNRHLLRLPKFAPLAETDRSERWWLDQLKMQSKS